MSHHLAHVMRIYQGSDGEQTRALYMHLEARGPRGIVAAFLMRAQKNSERAKVYRGHGYKNAAYDRKQWALEHLAAALATHAEDLGIAWGWGLDEAQPYHQHVLYVDLPNVGQVSFHTDRRAVGPDYRGAWDGQRGMSPQRICMHVARVLEHLEQFHDAPPTRPPKADRDGVVQEVNRDGSLTLRWLGRHEGDG